MPLGGGLTGYDVKIEVGILSCQTIDILQFRLTGVYYYILTLFGTLSATWYESGNIRSKQTPEPTP